MHTFLLILVEDDPQQAESISAAISKSFPGVLVIPLETECQFYNYIEKMGGEIPTLVICDVMLPWSYPDINAPEAPPAIREGTFRKAGIRCWERFRMIQRLDKVPWFYFTALDERFAEQSIKSDDYTYFLQKYRPINQLLDILRSHLTHYGV